MKLKVRSRLAAGDRQRLTTTLSWQQQIRG